MELNNILHEIMPKLPSYFMSHMYDIVSYEIGALAAVIICFFKDPIKNAFRKAVLKKTGIDVKNNDIPHGMDYAKATATYRRLTLFVALIAGIVSEIIYLAFAYFSPSIKVVSGWNLVVFLVPVGVYTIIEMIGSGWLGIICTGVILAITIVGNKIYCDRFQNHHKLCYAIKLSLVIFAIIGVLKQLIYIKNTNIKSEEQEK